MTLSPSEKYLVAYLKHFGKFLRIGFANWTFTVFHLRNMALGNTRALRKLYLCQAFFTSRPTEDYTGEFAIAYLGKSLAPRNRFFHNAEAQTAQRLFRLLRVLAWPHRSKRPGRFSRGRLRAYRKANFALRHVPDRNIGWAAFFEMAMVTTLIY